MQPDSPHPTLKTPLKLPTVRRAFHFNLRFCQYAGIFAPRCNAKSIENRNCRPASVLLTTRCLSVLAVLVASPLAVGDVICRETSSHGTPIVHNTPITTQFPAITFSSTTVLTGGIVNESETAPVNGCRSAESLVLP